MQDPSLYSQMNSAQVQHPQQQVQFPDQEHLKCPRCDSTNTKFCYYNNYNLSQPRHFCKSCRRYWTKGGTLRNIPVGGGSRKNAKRSSPSSSAAAKRAASVPASAGKGEDKSDAGEMTDKMPPKGDGFEGQFGNLLEPGGSFGSLLSAGGQFGNFIEGPPPGLQMGEHHHFGDPGSGRSMDPPALDSGGSNNNDNSNNGDGFLNNLPSGDGGGGWSGGSNGWPDLAMYTPGSTFL